MNGSHNPPPMRGSAQGLIGDSEEDGVQLVHTITRKIVEPDAK